jgi:hypothetical protein
MSTYNNRKVIRLLHALWTWDYSLFGAAIESYHSTPGHYQHGNHLYNRNNKDNVNRLMKTHEIKHISILFLGTSNPLHDTRQASRF